MTEYLPTSAVLTWVTSAGTTTLSADYRTFVWTPTIEKYDSTAGPDANATYVTGIKDFTAKYGGVHNSGTAGTALIAAFQIGQAGTLTFQSQGTATNLPKAVLPCLVMSNPVTNFNYKGLVEVSIDFQGNGAFTDSTN
jgi:hypothetical protein